MVQPLGTSGAINQNIQTYSNFNNILIPLIKNDLLFNIFITKINYTLNI